MTGFEVALASVGVILFLVYLGVQVPIALSVVSFIGVAIIRGDMGISADLLFLASTRAITEFLFAAVPLFVLMGLLVTAAGMARDSYDMANHVFRKLAGGLGVATVFANAIFAAITGVSVASAAIFSRISVPEMVRFGYSKRLAVGVVAGSSVLGMLIPPSVLLIVYAILAEVSVGAMFLAGVLPGLLLTLLYCLGLWAVAKLKPEMAPLAPKQAPAGERIESPVTLGRIVPIVCLVTIVLGGIYGGVFTPTESAAVGALGAFVIAILRKSLTTGQAWAAFNDAGMISASILFLIISATMYTRMLGVSGMPTELGNWVRGLNIDYFVLLLVYVAIIIGLGTMIDSISIMLIMVPIFLPIFSGMGADAVWFGIVTTLAAEIGLLTPPMGISVFVIKSSLDDQSITLGDIFFGAFPFALAMLAVLLIIVVVPEIALAWQ